MEKRIKTTDLLKVAIVGAESTGKTSLAEALANHYSTNMVIEFARPFLEKLGHPYTSEDVEAIASEQLKMEDILTKETRHLLVCDTNMLVIKIWMDHAYKKTPNWIRQEIEKRHYGLHILTDFDIPYEPDPLREHPELRGYFTQKYKDELEQRGLHHITVFGTPNERLGTAVQEIDRLLNH